MRKRIGRRLGAVSKGRSVAVRKNRHPVAAEHPEEPVLEQVGHQWAQRDWEGLAELDLDRIRDHPDRALLALLAAAARLQLGKDYRTARQLILFARSWGADQRLISRMLTSSVHDNLDRARRAAAGADTPRTAIAGLRASQLSAYVDRLLTHAVVTAHHPQSAMTQPPAASAAPATADAANDAQIASLQANVGALKELVEQQQADIKKLCDQQIEKLSSVQKSIVGTVKKEVANAARQVGDYMRLQHYFSTGEYQQVGLQTQGWPASTDFQFLLVKLVSRGNYDLIIEFGSGASTVVVAKVLNRLKTEHPDGSVVPFVSLDHLKSYLEKTRDQLVSAGVEREVQLVHAPLATEPVTPKGEGPYYDCRKLLHDISNSCASCSRRLLVIVDGPPANTAHHARYPACPLILECFSDAHVDFVLDDYRRQEEREIVDMWLDDIRAAGMTSAVERYDFEKGAGVVSVVTP